MPENPTPHHLDPEYAVLDTTTLTAMTLTLQSPYPATLNGLRQDHGRHLRDAPRLAEQLLRVDDPDVFPVLPYLRSAKVGSLTAEQYYALQAYGALLDDQDRTTWLLFLVACVIDAAYGGDLSRVPQNEQALLEAPPLPSHERRLPVCEDDLAPLRDGRHRFSVHRQDQALSISVSLSGVVTPFLFHPSGTPTTDPTHTPRRYFDRIRGQTLDALGHTPAVRRHYRRPAYRHQVLHVPEKTLDQFRRQPLGTLQTHTAAYTFDADFRRLVNHEAANPEADAAARAFSAWLAACDRFATSQVLSKPVPEALVLPRQEAVLTARDARTHDDADVLQGGPHFYFTLAPGQPRRLMLRTEVVDPDRRHEPWAAWYRRFARLRHVDGLRTLAIHLFWPLP